MKRRSLFGLLGVSPVIATGAPSLALEKVLTPQEKLQKACEEVLTDVEFKIGWDRDVLKDQFILAVSCEDKYGQKFGMCCDGFKAESASYEEVRDNLLKSYNRWKNQNA